MGEVPLHTPVESLRATPCTVHIAVHAGTLSGGCAVQRNVVFGMYRGTSPIRTRTTLRPYRRPMPRVLGGAKGGGRCLVGEVPL